MVPETRPQRAHTPEFAEAVEQERPAVGSPEGQRLVGQDGLASLS